MLLPVIALPGPQPRWMCCRDLGPRVARLLSAQTASARRDQALLGPGSSGEQNRQGRGLCVLVAEDTR